RMKNSTVIPVPLEGFPSQAATTNWNPCAEILDVVWNHRWESDKNPQAFFEALYQLQDEGVDFQVILTGENFRKNPTEFEAARERLSGRILQYGFVEDFADYARLLWQADTVISTAEHDFFGMSVVEAIYCGCTPLLANRLNYPYLIPESQHSACLFPRGQLTSYLRQHLTGQVMVDKAALKKHLLQFDRDSLIRDYDNVLAMLCD
ncbi:MAG: glycosyltransferase, partial [Aggregatilineales bacterium]